MSGSVPKALALHESPHVILLQLVIVNPLTAPILHSETEIQTGSGIHPGSHND